MERRVVIDDRGRAVMLEVETTGVVLDNEETAVHGVVLGNVLEQQQPAI